MHEKLVQIAMSQVGVRESGGNNRGPKIRTYQAASELPPGPWPWCAAFVDWCLQEWGRKPEVHEWLALKRLTFEKWRPVTARAFGLIEWANKRPATTQVISRKGPARPGDIVIYDFSHTGIVTSVSKQNIQVVEGNTNGRGDRDSDLGDGVWLKVRKPSLVRCYIRIRPSKG